MKNHNTFSKNTLLTILIASLMAAGNAYATGLGKLTVMSSRGQALRAEIELTSPDHAEIQRLVANLAPPETFRQADVAYNPSLQSLRFNIETRKSSYVLVVTSTQEINDPYLDFFIELNTNSGKLVREYTVVLEENTSVQMAQVKSTLKNVKPVPPVSTGPIVSTEKEPVKATPKNQTKLKNDLKKQKEVALIKPEQKNTNATSPSDKNQQYQVKAGDTLMGIARANAGDAQLDQMMLSIYQSNEKLFSDENMNRLQAGKVLTIPSVDSVKANPIANPQSIIKLHSSKFHSYRTKLAEAVLKGKARKNTAALQESKSSVSTKVQNEDPVSTIAVDKLKLTKITKEQKGNKKKMTEEDVIAKNKALEDANERLKELENNVNDLNKVLEVKNNTALNDSSAKDISEDESVAEKKLASRITYKTSAPQPPIDQNKTWFDSLMSWFDIKYLVGAGFTALIGLIVAFLMRRQTNQSAK